MNDDITDISGLEVGHAEDFDSLTGCTVVLARHGAVVGVDVRGLAPGTRETDLCRPGTLVEHAHAVLLAGGSAFGLNAAAGVMQFLWERGVGLDVGVTRVPIVPGAVIFDLGIGTVAWPDFHMGYEACRTAGGGPITLGCVGAGTGATIGKIFGMTSATKSGIGSATGSVGRWTVSALIVVNAFGDVYGVGEDVMIAGARWHDGSYVNTSQALLAGNITPSRGENTTIGVIATDAPLTALGASHLASTAHDGLARAVKPVHTIFDGDTIFSLATGQGPVLLPREVMALGAASVDVVARAIVKAVQRSHALGGVPAWED